MKRLPAGFGRRDLLCIISVVFAALAARLPLARFERLYGDEPFYAYLGSLWLAGVAPYVSIYDVKPPGLFALYAISEGASGDALVGVWALPTLSVLSSALGLWWIGRSWFRDGVLGAAAAVLYAVYSLTMSGAMGVAVLLMQPFVVWGLVCVRSGHTWLAFIGGWLLGLAVSVHQVAGFEAVFAVLMVAFLSERSGRMRRLIAVCAGGAVAPVAFAVIYAAQGHLGELWTAAVVSALFRTKGDGLTFLEGLSRVLPLLQPALPLLAASLLALALRDKLAPPVCAPTRVLVGWCAFSLAGIIALRATYDQYTITLLPQLALGSALFLRLVAERAGGMQARGVRVQLIVAPFLLGLLVFPFALVSWRSEWPNENRHVRSLADAIRAIRAPAGGADIYSVDHEPALYLASGNLPPTRFIYPQHLLCDFPLPPGLSAEAELERIMAQRPRFVVKRRAGVQMVCARAERIEWVRAVLARDYEVVASFGAEPDAVDLFQLR
jgi:hypothetical protein